MQNERRKEIETVCNADVTEDNIENDWNEPCYCSFKYNLTVVFDILTLQNKDNTLYIMYIVWKN